MANDMIIILVISVIFIGLGSVLPFIQEDLDISPVVTTDTEEFVQDIGEEADSAVSLTIFTVLFSVLKMFFFTFGDLPFLIDVFIFIPLRLILVLTIARNIWIGGGS